MKEAAELAVDMLKMINRRSMHDKLTHMLTRIANMRIVHQNQGIIRKSHS
jgi:hypothetical protein